MALSSSPKEIRCKECGAKLTLQEDIDDWNRHKEWYSDPDGETEKGHVCFKKYCYRCGELVDKWLYLENWNGSSIGLQKVGTGMSFCLKCRESMFHDWIFPYLREKRGGW